MSSPLLLSSEGFRKKIIVKNLAPYSKSPVKASPPINYDYVSTVSSVKDTPDQYIDEPIFANQLYVKNQYGAVGGYKQVPDPNALMGKKSNEGEYGPQQQDAKILDQGYQAARKWKPLNAYANGTTVIDSGEDFSSLNVVYPDGGRTPNGQPYPTTFNPSTYNPVSILLSKDPQGSNGLLSSDSYIARLGANRLRKDFETRIAFQIVKNTVGRANIFNARSGTDLVNIVTGRIPLIQPDYRITTPSNPILAATDFALRLAGSIIPTSPIIGSYFDPNINSGQPTTIQQITNAFRKTQVGKFFSRVLGFGNTGSELFLNNTGPGQKSRLFDNLDYNRYKPNYNRTILDRLGGAIVGTSVGVSNYYVGSTTSEPSRITSPSGDIPVDSFAREIASPVYGPSELAKLYEGPDISTRLGANGPSYGNGGGIEGGFTWVSPKYKGNAGKKVGINGLITNIDEDFRPSSYNSTESTNYEYRNGSILDDTQRIIESQPSGGRRLQHVGNAIDQVSKVFNDGYRELTKGSQVIKYTGAIGQEVGTEYCRVFAKDVPYLQYNDLQKVDGITTKGRKIAYSVLDNSYNLNIYPNRRDSAGNSTNIVGSTENGYAQKYMFSLENLAWRSSSTPGYTWADLPICERGPNRGRVMWFPPYDFKFSESSSSSWKDSSFIGRPEPIYTYSNTNRTGNISFKIVVDHPSILNLLVNKVMSDETNNERVNSMLSAFFAGCLKYDLYELAEKYPLVNPNELYLVQQELNQGKLSKEQIGNVNNTLTTGNNSPNGQDSSIASNPALETSNIQTQLTGIGFYFENEEPNNQESYSVLYDQYITRKSIIIEQSITTTEPYLSGPQQVTSFFSDVIEWNYKTFNEQLLKVYQGFLSGNVEKIIFNFKGTTSSSTNKSYNSRINLNRIESVKTYILNYKPSSGKKTLSETSNGKITFNIVAEEQSVKVKTKSGYGSTYVCGEKDSKKTNISIVNTVNAMACRKVSVSSVVITPKTPVAQTPANSTNNNTTTTDGTPRNQPKGILPTVGLSKKVLRLLMSECDYFEAIKENTPMVYDNLKEKLKFFNPTFHSTTPEGLNSRLTFLNQCMRPGETIPVVKSVDGKSELQYNNAVNTAFGSPPVLVLRIGDFFNTKILPDNLQISYEELDLNPEGIGIQPMIATVQLSFKFVGGSGIKEAVDKLQNALSFNYYANTEIYDERADATDKASLEQYDLKFEAMYKPVPPPTTNEIQNNNGQSNGGMIGEIVTKEVTDAGTLGEVSYDKFFTNVSNKTQDYFQNTINKNKDVLNQYNECIRQIWSLSRNYDEGKILGVGLSNYGLIFGKPSNFQKNINSLFSKLQNQIESNDDEFISYMESKNYTPKLIRVLKNNYKNYLTQKQSTYMNALSKIIQDFTVQQQSYILEIARLNTITYGRESGLTKLSGTDGFQEKNGNVVYYYTTGDALSILVSDTVKVREALADFSEKSQTIVSEDDFAGYLVQKYDKSFDVNIPFTEVSKTSTYFAANTNKKLQYALLSMDVIEDTKYNGFKSFMIDDILNNKKLMEGGNDSISLVGDFDNYWKLGAKPNYQKENDTSKKMLDYIEKNTMKNLIPFIALKNQSPKKLDFSNYDNNLENSLKQERKKLIESLGKTENTTSNTKTFNDEIGGVSITKVKLN